MEDRIIDGLKLMVIGMGSVFLFLSLMVLLMHAAARLLAPYAAIFERPDVSVKPRARTGKNGNTADHLLIAAATAAVHRYRKEHKN